MTAVQTCRDKWKATLGPSCPAGPGRPVGRKKRAREPPSPKWLAEKRRGRMSTYSQCHCYCDAPCMQAWSRRWCACPLISTFSAGRYSKCSAPWGIHHDPIHEVPAYATADRCRGATPRVDLAVFRGKICAVWSWWSLCFWARAWPLLQHFLSQLNSRIDRQSGKGQRKSSQNMVIVGASVASISTTTV